MNVYIFGLMRYKCTVNKFGILTEISGRNSFHVQTFFQTIMDATNCTGSNRGFPVSLCGEKSGSYLVECLRGIFVAGMWNGRASLCERLHTRNFTEGIFGSSFDRTYIIRRIYTDYKIIYLILRYIILYLKIKGEL